MGYIIKAWSTAAFAGLLLLGLSAGITIFYLFAMLLIITFNHYFSGGIEAERIIDKTI